MIAVAGIRNIDDENTPLDKLLDVIRGYHHAVRMNE